MKVIIVEARSVIPLVAGKYAFDTDLAHVSSSWEKAIAWMRGHADFCAKDIAKGLAHYESASAFAVGHWWWVAYEQTLDGPDVPDGMVRFFDLEVKEMRLQPLVPPVFPMEV